MKEIRILVVEDEGVVAMNTKLSLMGLGYDVLPIAISGKTALELAQKHHPDLVLMDIKLRGSMDGIETAVLIRKEHDVPIIYMTAHTDDDTVSRADSTRHNGFLKKPVMENDLHKAIISALQNRS